MKRLLRARRVRYDFFPWPARDQATQSLAAEMALRESGEVPLADAPDYLDLVAE